MVRLTMRLLQRVPEYWKRYSDRAINRTCAPARYVPLRGWVGQDKRQSWVYTNCHPGTIENQGQNVGNHMSDILYKELIEPIKEGTIFPGDRVEILVGRDKGKQGIVSRIVPERNWVFVEDLNMQFQPNSQAFMMEMMPLEMNSEVALVDPGTEKAATEVEWRYTASGVKVRVVYPSGVFLRLSEASEVLADGVNPSTYLENKATDTTAKQLGEPTYEANQKTFEQDIMDKMGIVETKKRGKTYWY